MFFKIFEPYVTKFEMTAIQPYVHFIKIYKLHGSLFITMLRVECDFTVKQEHLKNNCRSSL